MTTRKPNPEDPELMTPDEVASLFRVDPKTVKRWASRGKISALRTPGGHLRYRRQEVKELLAQVTKKETSSE